MCACVWYTYILDVCTVLTYLEDALLGGDELRRLPHECSHKLHVVGKAVDLGKVLCHFLAHGGRAARQEGLDGLALQNHPLQPQKCAISIA
jgi:hypothetical protein